LPTLLEQIVAPVGGLDLSPIACARAISATSNGKPVHSAAPIAEARLETMYRQVTSIDAPQQTNIAILRSGFPAPRPGKLKSPPQLWRNFSRIAIDASANGTRCSFSIFMRSAGMIHSRSAEIDLVPQIHGASGRRLTATFRQEKTPSGAPAKSRGAERRRRLGH
jgi:hypothetical protein